MGVGFPKILLSTPGKNEGGNERGNGWREEGNERDEGERNERGKGERGKMIGIRGTEVRGIMKGAMGEEGGKQHTFL